MFQALMTLADESARRLQDTQARLLQTGASPASAPDQAHLARIPLQHLGAFHSVLSNIAARQLQLGQGLLASAFQPAPNAAVMMEALQMQQAVFQRLGALQSQFMEDLAELAVGAASMKKANTLSKLMDQEYDFVAQFNALLTGQVTSLVELLENIQVGYGVLLARRVEGP